MRVAAGAAEHLKGADEVIDQVVAHLFEAVPHDTWAGITHLQPAGSAGGQGLQTVTAATQSGIDIDRHTTDEGTQGR